MRSRAWLITGRVVLALACLATVLCVSLYLGALRVDEMITDHRGTDTARVLAVNFDRTVIRYTTPNGRVHIPPNGVLYPEGLRTGQLVRIEYDTTNPQLARVAGRSAVATLLPLGVVLASTWILAGAVLWWTRRKRRAMMFLSGQPQAGALTAARR